MSLIEQKKVVLQDEFLLNCQVDTPVKIVENLWNMLNQEFGVFDSVLDLGAGDGIFALYGNYNSYDGFEIDARRKQRIDLPVGARIFYRCAFSETNKKYDLCIGNPPYIKHNKVQNVWQEAILKNLENKINFKVNKNANIFLLFLLQALLKTKEDGVVAQIIPYEWVTRPSYKSVRSYIKEKKWNVSVYKFSHDIFDNVLTTASITIIDKSKRESKFELFNIDSDFNISPIANVTGTKKGILKHSRRRESNFAQRGLSPGNQKIFCLTETEREEHNLCIGQDVVPCLTTLKPLPYKNRLLSQKVFSKYYIGNNQRCWIISPSDNNSLMLTKYLNSIPLELRSNYTCRNQTPWWNYHKHSSPDIVYNPGFKIVPPRFLINSIDAIVVGSVFGIHNVKNITKRDLVDKLRNVDFQSQLLEYSDKFQRIEVNQMNTVINNITSELQA